MCIICGNVGCGRYTHGHAKQHFEQTQHHLALEIATQRVWDYVADNYVHRVITNKTDGKLVELRNNGESEEIFQDEDWEDNECSGGCRVDGDLNSSHA